MKRGFTLVELAIVLVIIGLIIGGILVAKSMMETSTLVKLTKELEQIKVATQLFNTRYNCLPGDCGNATALGIGTSGNGNGFIGVSSACFMENIRFWEHLQNTEIYKTNLTSYDSSGCNKNGVFGFSAPYSVLNNKSGYTFNWESTVNYLILCEGTCVVNTSKAISSSMAAALDKKTDDGMPYTGDTQVLVSFGEGNANRCSNTTSNAANIRYDVSTSRTCALVFNNFENY